MAKRRVRVGKKQNAWVKWVVAIGIVALLGATFAASVGVGNWLLRTAEKYPAGEQTPNLPEVPKEEILQVTVPHVKAHAYRIGDRYSSYVNAGIAHLCAPLRTEQGALAFKSAVCERADWEENGSVDLAGNVENLHYNNLYLCAYVPINGFSEQDKAMRELMLSYEAALIAEAAAAGVDEIFLCGLAPTQANVTELVQYLRRVKVLAGDCAIGVQVTPDVLLAAHHDAYTAAQLLSVCDFLVLDLRGLPVNAAETENEIESATEAGSIGGQQTLSVAYVMENMQYELTRYSPRLALSGEQIEALDYVIEHNYGNWLIMGERE